VFKVGCYRRLVSEARQNPGTYRERTPEELSQLRVKAERERDERYR
jgi:hypothetical protein